MSGVQETDNPTTCETGTAGCKATAAPIAEPQGVPRIARHGRALRSFLGHRAYENAHRIGMRSQRSSTPRSPRRKRALHSQRSQRSPPFHVYRTDRADHLGGGCAILVKRSLAVPSLCLQLRSVCDCDLEGQQRCGICSLI
ncbi:hypothetical protein Trydic_g11754 [Trypoxylus dichotomus]